jgi:hypothetical protein
MKHERSSEILVSYHIHYTGLKARRPRLESSNHRESFPLIRYIIREIYYAFLYCSNFKNFSQRRSSPKIHQPAFWALFFNKFLSIADATGGEITILCSGISRWFKPYEILQRNQLRLFRPQPSEPPAVGMAKI